MPIKSINQDNCTACLQCYKDCPVSCFVLSDDKKQVFFDKRQPCILCGHCIAICPHDAIIYKNLKDESITFKGIQDPQELVSYENCHKFLISKRSIRQYKKKKVPRNIMEKILNTMRYSATATNVRNLKCRIISNEKKIKELSEAIVNALLSSPNVSELYKNILKRRLGYHDDIIFYEAPLVIIMHSNNISDMINATICITHGMLAAQALGLGSCWIGLAFEVLRSDKKIRTELAGISDKVLGVFILGYPKSKYYRTPPRPPLKVEGLESLD
ncbi:MAG: nitroreductase family protein [Promethearchaeota archaeon]